MSKSEIKYMRDLNDVYCFAELVGYNKLAVSPHIWL